MSDESKLSLINVANSHHTALKDYIEAQYNIRNNNFLEEREKLLQKESVGEWTSIS